MNFVLQPWQLYFVILAGWINRQQQEAFEYVRTENQVLMHRVIFFGESSLRRATVSNLGHYHGERNHQGLDNKIIAPSVEVGQSGVGIQCRERLGGMLRYYYRDAA